MLGQDLVVVLAQLRSRAADEGWGLGELVWRLHYLHRPQLRILHRAKGAALFEERVFQDLLLAQNGPGWYARFGEHHQRRLIVRGAREPLFDDAYHLLAAGEPVAVCPVVGVVDELLAPHGDAEPPPRAVPSLP